MKTYSWHSAGGSLSDTYDVVAQVTNITTVSGAPASVTVTTPVMDMGKSMNCTVQQVPSTGTLEWRASDTPFTENGSSPPWNNPDGNYRYWQARVTWTDANQLLERVEFVSAEPIIARVRYSALGWLIYHRNVSAPYRPVEKPVGGVPYSIEQQGDSVQWQGDAAEYITTRDA
ncbi:MAG: hypothetical protein KatS3mg023_0595 [Armatimonadota bacterium]|nr:MAG: hypothetical protein KatS3mg023_0595 [Armatimonadota bacterium]